MSKCHPSPLAPFALQIVTSSALTKAFLLPPLEDIHYVPQEASYIGPKATSAGLKMDDLTDTEGLTATKAGLSLLAMLLGRALRGEANGHRDSGEGDTDSDEGDTDSGEGVTDSGEGTSDSVPQKEGGQKHRKHRADAADGDAAGDADGDAAGDGFAGEQVLAVLESIAAIVKMGQLHRHFEEVRFNFEKHIFAKCKCNTAFHATPAAAARDSSAAAAAAAAAAALAGYS
jgi:hypothetical protein